MAMSGKNTGISLEQMAAEMVELVARTAKEYDVSEADLTALLRGMFFEGPPPSPGE